MNKLYALHVVKNQESNSRIIACSNEIDKLTSVIVTADQSNTFLLQKDPNDKTLRITTKDNVYPKFLIREIPYIC